jgi:tetratricopeptide (TPR) repeat protein
VLREIVSLDPNNVNAQGNLGVLLFFNDEYAEAIPHLSAALQSQPDLLRIEALLGIAEKRTGHPNEAQKHLEGAFSNLDDKKIQIQAGLELIELYSASVQLDKALSVAVKLQEVSPQNPQILLVTYQLARQMMDQSLLSMMMSAPDSAEMHMIMAGELGRQGDHVTAIAQYREALRLNPMLPGAHYELAEQLRTSSDPALNAQAEAEYKAAIRVNQYDEMSWRQLAGIMTAKGDFKTAAEDYKKALALQPKDSDAKTGLAIALISMDETKEAISLLESAVKDDPTNLVAHYRLSILYRRAGRTPDAEREMDTFHHYQDVKDKLSKVFKNFAAPTSPM